MSVLCIPVNAFVMYQTRMKCSRRNISYCRKSLQFKISQPLYQPLIMSLEMCLLCVCLLKQAAVRQLVSLCGNLYFSALLVCQFSRRNTSSGMVMKCKARELV